MLARRRTLPLLIALLSLTVSVAVAAPTSAAQSPVPAASIVGIWNNAINCQGLVEAANEAQLRTLAPTVVAGYFPALTPHQPLHGADTCPGHPVALTHEHFFTSDGFFGSFDDNGDVVDFGRYTVVSADTLFICSEVDPPACAGDDFQGTFRFTVSGDNGGLRLDPLITREQRAQALAAPNDFTEAVWMLSVAYAGHTWDRRSCDFC